MDKKLTITIDGVKKTMPKINVKTYYLLSDRSDGEIQTVEQKAEIIIVAFGLNIEPDELIEKADPVEFDTAAMAIPKMVLDIMSKASTALKAILGNGSAPKE